MENNLYVSPSPHIHSGDSISKKYVWCTDCPYPGFLGIPLFLRSGSVDRYGRIGSGLYDIRVFDPAIPDEKGTEPFAMAPLS